MIMQLELKQCLRQRPREPREGTHCWFILQILKDKMWHGTIQIMEMKGVLCRNLAVAARIHDLKTRFGYSIQSKIGNDGQGCYLLENRG